MKGIKDTLKQFDNVNNKNYNEINMKLELLKCEYSLREMTHDITYSLKLRMSLMDVLKASKKSVKKVKKDYDKLKKEVIGFDNDNNVNLNLFISCSGATKHLEMDKFWAKCVKYATDNQQMNTVEWLKGRGGK